MVVVQKYHNVEVKIWLQSKEQKNTAKCKKSIKNYIN
jgi:hypothetical protein